MAFTGMKYCVAAPVKAETRGQALTYDTGVVVGRAIGANVNWNRNSDALYADDALAESDNSLTGGTVDINVDDINDEAQLVIFSQTKTDGTNSGPDVYHENGDPSPYIGLGYYRVRRYKGVETYVAYWIHKTQLAINSESAATKGNTISWQTPTATGNVMAVVNDSTGKNQFRDRATFTDESKAIEWLNTKANIAA